MGRSSQIDCLVVSYGSPDLLRTCLDSVRRYGGVSNIYVYDNLSEYSSQIRALSAEYVDVEWYFGTANRGFAFAVNYLARESTGDLLLLNPDAELISDLAPLYEFAAGIGDVACVGCPRAASGDEQWDSAHRKSGLVRSIVSHAGYSDRLRGTLLSDLYSYVPRHPVGYVEGSLLFIPRTSWEAVGPFDERFFLYSEEADWQRRAVDEGLRSWILPAEAPYRHAARGTVSGSSDGMSRSANFLRSSQVLYLKKHHGRIAAGVFELALSIMDRTQRSKRRHSSSQPGQGETPQSALPAGKVLYVASTGGHLAQLDKLSGRFADKVSRSVWITFRNSQSESLMRGRDVEYINYVRPRDWRGVLRSFRPLWKTVRAHDVDCVVSTGAAIAFPAMVVAILLRKHAVYIESISRVNGPSTTGKVIARLPRVNRFTQYSHWQGPRWVYEISLFDLFVADNAVTDSVEPKSCAHQMENSLSEDACARATTRIFVTLGTIAPYRFDALVDAVVAIADDVDCSIVWQLGATVRSDLPGRVEYEISASDFADECSKADVVVTHAGVGTCIGLLERGIKPIVVPRRSARDEHIDDHQAEITAELSARGLVWACEAPDLNTQTVLLALVGGVRSP